MKQKKNNFEEGTPEWWAYELVLYAKKLKKNPGDKNLANASSKVSYAALVANNIRKSLQDKAELDELRKKVNEIVQFRSKETII